MKIAILTDNHFGVRNGSNYYLENLEQFYSNVFFPTLLEKGIKHVWMLGDTWEYRKYIDVNVLHRTRKMYFDRLEDLGISVTMIYGNHDVYFKNTNDVNSIDFIGKMYPNVHVVKSHEVLNFDGLNVAFISWINKQNLGESLEFIKTAPAPFLCGHFEISSFEMTKGHVCVDGFDKSLFDRYETVLSGHFHVMSNDGKINYISNTNQSNWSDYGQKKGFRVLDTSTREMELVENPYWVYGKITYTDDINIIEFDYEHFRNKIVRVYVKSFSVCNQQKLSLFLERLNQFTHATDVFEIDDTQFSHDSIETDGVDMRRSIESYIDDAVENNLLDKPRLKEYFFSLYDQAIQQEDAA